MKRIACLAAAVASVALCMASDYVFTRYAPAP
jgi:hypothetical protein